ncbi:hypothetical protein [Proteiniclasticum ruminis]|nr:hypothetical protein [Proteiniclasticum ruminis]
MKNEVFHEKVPKESRTSDYEVFMDNQTEEEVAWVLKKLLEKIGDCF